MPGLRNGLLPGGGQYSGRGVSMAGKNNVQSIPTIGREGHRFEPCSSHLVILYPDLALCFRAYNPTAARHVWQ